MEKPFLELSQYIYLISFLRYFIVSGIFFFIFYKLFRNKWFYKKIQSKSPKSKDYKREVGYSLATMFIFTSVGLTVFDTPLLQYTQIYAPIDKYGYFYWFVSIIAMIFLHDTYFYWMHRGLHHPKLYKYVHLIHHKSTNPSPWASLAFHPIEAVGEAFILYLVVFLIPFHPTAMLLFLSFIPVYNAYGHLGYEIMPKKFNKHFIGKWFNTSVNHNQHHEKFNGNYGLYFLFWDRWMGTIRDDYDERYAETDKKRAQKQVKETKLG